MSQRTFVINVQVNTAVLAQQSGTGTWERPVGAGTYWKNNVRMTCVCSDPAVPVTVGTGDDFSLEVKQGDKIRWIVSEMNPILTNFRTVCMYGFKTNERTWNKYLTTPHISEEQIATGYLTKGFNGETPPSGTWLQASAARISIPQSTALVDFFHASTEDVSIAYYMKLLLIDYSNGKPEVLKYIQIDPRIIIKSRQSQATTVQG